MRRIYNTDGCGKARHHHTGNEDCGKKENIDTEEEIRNLVAKGQAVICANRLHTCIHS